MGFVQSDEAHQEPLVLSFVLDVSSDVSAKAEHKTGIEVLLFVFVSQNLYCLRLIIFLIEPVERCGSFPVVAFVFMPSTHLIFPDEFELHAAWSKRLHLFIAIEKRQLGC